VEYESIKKLINDVGNSKIASLEIDFPDGTKISMIKESCDTRNSEYRENTTKEYSNTTKQIVEEPSQEEINQEQIYKYIKSPMVGTFYAKPSPNEKDFISVGEKISKGKTTCIIEAMKLMNEIESEFEGEVVEILKKDGEPVEFGENLIKLK